MDDDHPPTEYTAQAASPIVNGEVRLTIGENAFTAAALFDTAEVPFVGVRSIEFADYTVIVRADGGDYAFSRMGSWAQPFFDALCNAYSAAVLRAFFVSGEPLLSPVGDYRFTEGGVAVSGPKAPIRVYDGCIVALPPNADARRIPLCFVNGMEKGGYGLTLRLGTGEEYTFSKLGYGADPFAEAVEKQIRALRERSAAAARDIDPSLSPAQASQIAKIMPEGAAAPMGRLAEAAPSFAAAVEAKIAQTRAADSYGAFKDLCGPGRVWVGLKKNIPGREPAADGEQPDPYLIWMIAPSPDGRHLAVEFAVKQGESAATFVYRVEGDVQRSAADLNRALEAIGFRREAIRLTDEELAAPGNEDYLMAAKRTASLRHVRSCFVGRAVHSSPESWRRKLEELWGGPAPPG